jgi:hypothetical protein
MQPVQRPCSGFLPSPGTLNCVFGEEVRGERSGGELYVGGECAGRGSFRRMSWIAASSSEITLAEVGVGVGSGGGCCCMSEEKFTRMRCGGRVDGFRLALSDASKGINGRF